MQPTRNTLSENIRAQSVELLNKHLVADLFAEIPRGVDHQLWFVESHAAPK